MASDLNARAFSIISYVLLAAIAVGAVYMALAAQWLSALALAGIAVLAILFIFQRHRLPAIFTFLFVSAGVINAAGYILQLWKTPVWFDEAVHFYTSFTVMAAIGWLLLSGTRANAAGHAFRFTAAVTGIGVVLGIFWEIFEWIIGIIGTQWDTIMDLVMDMLGAIAAGLFCAWAARKEPNRLGSRDESGTSSHPTGDETRHRPGAAQPYH